MYKIVSERLGANDLRYLSPDDVRTILKTYKLIKYNSYTSRIITVISGIGPPQIPLSIIQRSGALFNQVLDIQKKIFKTDKNRRYYPYYIYKLFESLLTGQHLRILYYIHLQSRETIANSDRDWMEICKHLDGIEWKRTSLTYGSSLHQNYITSLG